MSADGVMTDYPSRLSNFIKSNMEPQSATVDQCILKKESIDYRFILWTMINMILAILFSGLYSEAVLKRPNVER